MDAGSINVKPVGPPTKVEAEGTYAPIDDEAVHSAPDEPPVRFLIPRIGERVDNRRSMLQAKQKSTRRRKSKASKAMRSKQRAKA